MVLLHGGGICGLEIMAVLPALPVLVTYFWVMRDRVKGWFR